ncbi:MAG: DUF2887 domain-containing protein [Nostoc sp. NMS1]|uniref:DUF2887 domain-containing protein n=1 Tax=unclassified Nostoc TaxID=2593658 RepID=UPI0025D027D5|nr:MULTISPECIES: DUF2887 domain-containing protein [unclassified Nostoc]MBN3907142.1 DUF2887 domain-containing protein [Nostoc sp. NMS1]MBN3991050.1 DUF2887 domain-containing protein [Nostoc sp. NMS2]
MRRDSIFYKLFQQSPTLLFELLTNPPTNANAYQFDSVAVKEPKFEIDGVFLLPESETPGVVYFCEERLGELSEEIRSSISGLSLPVLEELSDALLDFTTLADLQSWLEGRIN